MKTTLHSLRKKIDALDVRLVTLLNQRAGLSLAIGEEKTKNSSGIYSPHREKEVLRRIQALNKGPMSYEDFQAIYREIMSSSLALEKSLRIAYLGTEGSHTHLAANKKFGSRVTYVPCEGIAEVFQKVEHADCDYGVVPIENSTEGAVTHTFDLLVDSELKACAQILMNVSHHLLAHTHNFKRIQSVYSNPQVFGQCRNWLLNNMPQAGQIAVASTTEAVRRASKEKGASAIASSLAAKFYGLPIVRSNIEDIAHNITRFLVLAAHDAPRTGKDRTTILFSIKDKVGALHAMLTPFAHNRINLTKIESRPAKKKAWDYYFFVDFEGHRLEKNVRKALEKLEGMCKYLKVVGSYPVMD